MTDKDALTQLFGEHSGWTINHSLKTADGYDVYTVAVDRNTKPKRYVLPMDGTKLADGTIAYATLDHTGVWTIKGYAEKQSAVTFHATVTQSDIDAAPDWVKAITPVEVTDDDD